MLKGIIILTLLLYLPGCFFGDAAINGYEPESISYSLDSLSTIFIQGTMDDSLFSSADPLVTDSVVIIPDYLGNVLRVYSEKGELIARWGGSGQGPGEFQMPYVVRLDSRGRFVVNDKGNARIQILSEDGYYIDGFQATGQNENIFILKDNGNGDEIVRVVGVSLCKTGSCIVQDYNIDTGQKIREFAELDEPEKIFIHSWSVYQSPKELVLANILESRLFIYSNDGSEINTLDISSPSFVMVPFDELPPHPREQVKWFRTNKYTSIVAVALVEDLLFIQHFKNNFGDPDKPYLIDVFSAGGRLLDSGREWNSKLVRVDGRKFTFVKKVSNDYGRIEITNYTLSHNGEI